MYHTAHIFTNFNKYITSKLKKILICRSIYLSEYAHAHRHEDHEMTSRLKTDTVPI